MRACVALLLCCACRAVVNTAPRTSNPAQIVTPAVAPPRALCRHCHLASATHGHCQVCGAPRPGHLLRGHAHGRRRAGAGRQGPPAAAQRVSLACWKGVHCRMHGGRCWRVPSSPCPCLTHCLLPSPSACSHLRGRALSGDSQGSADENVGASSNLTAGSKRPRRAASGGVLGAVAAEAGNYWTDDLVSPPLKRAASLPVSAPWLWWSFTGPCWACAPTERHVMLTLPPCPSAPSSLPAARPGRRQGGPP